MDEERSSIFWTVYRWLSVAMGAVSLVALTSNAFQVPLSETLARFVGLFVVIFDPLFQFVGASREAGLVILALAWVLSVIGRFWLSNEAFRKRLADAASSAAADAASSLVVAASYVGRVAIWFLQLVLVAIISQLILTFPPFKEALDKAWSGW